MLNGYSLRSLLSLLFAFDLLQMTVAEEVLVGTVQIILMIAVITYQNRTESTHLHQLTHGFTHPIF